MATFTSEVAANTTAKGSYGTGSIFPAGPRDAGQFVQSELNYDIPSFNYYITFEGNFDLEQGFPVGGNATHIFTGSGQSPVGLQAPMQEFQADVDNEFFDINVLIAAFDDPDAYFSYLFRGHDMISGSQFNDKLDGYKGNDIVIGGDGNDKLYGNKGKDDIAGELGKDKMWGGKSKDKFYYAEGYGKDKVMDWEKKKDKVVFDNELVSSFKDVEDAATEKGNKVIVNFGSGDKLIFKNTDFSDFKKSSVMIEDFV